ncbi:MAG: hypothetical protein EPO31_07195 [Gammaproteobacteria bacterium]|nr:MAG: hypothetical protein EPO31_07195 [Gammaproteobacteria bacterium]
MTSLQELRDLEACVVSDDPDALYLRGMMYWTGRWIEGVVIPQDKRKALDMIQRAADNGHEAAALFIVEHRELPNVDAEHYDKSNTPDVESTNNFTTVPAGPAQSAEIALPEEDRGVASDDENPFLLLGFWEFAIIATLAVVFFPWSLLFSVLFYGMETTKFLILALLHDFLKTLGAVIAVVLIVLGIVSFILL